MAGLYGWIQGGCCYSAAKACLVALERSSRVTGFIIKTLIPRVAAFSLDIFSLNPVERIIGISGRICSNSFANLSPVISGMVISVITRS